MFSIINISLLLYSNLLIICQPAIIWLEYNHIWTGKTTGYWDYRNMGMKWV